MQRPDKSADQLIYHIDAGLLRPSKHAVVRALCNHLDLGSEDRAMLSAFDGGEELSMSAEALWLRIQRLGPEKDGVPRLLNLLTGSDELIDFHLAGYVIHWARQEQVAEHDICLAFGMREQPQ